MALFPLLNKLLAVRYIMETERTAYNEAKADILEVLIMLGPCNAIKVALTTGRTPECASMNMLRYCRQGLLSRRTLQGKEQIYEITERGRERLDWLQANAKTTGITYNEFM